VIIPPIAEWDCNQVSSFLDSLGLSEYSKVAIYSNVTGADIQDFDEDIWNETFGIFGTSEL